MRRRAHMTACLCLLAGLAAPATASAAIARFGVFIGNNAGAADERTLRYAESDAARMYRVMRSLGGFHAENVALLQGESPQRVSRALIALNDRIRRWVHDGRNQAVLFVYYSGHGDANSLHLGDGNLSLPVLEQLVRGSAATVRLLVVDACRSGGLTRVKGARATSAFRIAVDERLAGEGVVFLTSSSANEDAHESDALKGSFFTHYLVSGMLGAADTDASGDVSLQEAYRYAYGNTLRASSRTLGGTQHPTFRYDLRGKGNVTLTTLAQASRGTLAFPRGLSYLVLKNDAGGDVVAEVNLHDRARRISVRPGRYFVRGRARDHLLEGTIYVRRGQRLAIVNDQLKRTAYARLVRKGGTLQTAHSVHAGYRARTGIAEGAGPCWGLVAGYAIDLRHYSVVPRLGACRSLTEHGQQQTRIMEVDAELRLIHAWDFPVVTVEVGGGAGVSVLHQRFTTGIINPPRLVAAGTLSLSLGLTAEVHTNLYLSASLSGVTYLLRTRSSEQPTGDAFEARAALRTTVALGRRF